MISARAGLLDLNSELDSIEPAALMINSSQGVGPDLSRSGRNGPSIFPVSSLGARLEWALSERWKFRAAIFEGVPGDPTHPDSFVTVQLVLSEQLHQGGGRRVSPPFAPINQSKRLRTLERAERVRQTDSDVGLP